jgi:hypothetical protein
MDRNFLKAEKYLASGVAAISLFALGGAACGNKSVENCRSPLRSHYVPGDPSAQENDQNTWTQGEELDTNLPEDAKRLRVFFTDPGENEHVSKWIDRSDATIIAMRIGHIGTKISTQIEAANGSLSCEIRPPTTFSTRPFAELIYEGATEPAGWHREQ